SASSSRTTSASWRPSLPIWWSRPSPEAQPCRRRSEHEGPIGVAGRLRGCGRAPGGGGPADDGARPHGGGHPPAAGRRSGGGDRRPHPGGPAPSRCRSPVGLPGGDGGGRPPGGQRRAQHPSRHPGALRGPGHPAPRARGPGGGLSHRDPDRPGRPLRGLLCSQAELGAGPDGDGLWILPEEAPVGRPLAEVVPLAGQVLEFETYANRPDYLSILGLAREWSAASGKSLRLPPAGCPEGEVPVEERVAVSVEAPDLCLRYAARWVEGVTIGPSPRWMQERLLQAGMRPINNVVDVTNYVMLEMGQPLHAFDADRVREGASGKATLVIRRARPGERLVTLDGVQRALTPE